MTHNKQTEYTIVPVENGWLLYARNAATPGFESPRYVFTDSLSLGRAITNLADHGTIDAPSARAFVGTGLPGHAVTCPAGILNTIHANHTH